MTNTIRAEVITIGDEILFGQITDTNTAWIGTELTNIGIRVVRKTSVGDQREAILQVFSEPINVPTSLSLRVGLGRRRTTLPRKPCVSTSAWTWCATPTRWRW